MVAILNITKGKNKVIMSGLAGVLSALIFLTAIHIAAKIVIIASTAIVTYLLLSLIHEMNKPAKIDEVLEDKEKDIVISGEEPGKTEAELEEERKEEVIKREQQRMEKRSLGGPIDVFGEPVLDEIKTTEGSHSVDYTKTMVVSKCMNGAYQEITDATDTLRTSVHIESKNKSTRNPAEWLLQYGNVNDDVRKMLEQPATQKFNGLEFNM